MSVQCAWVILSCFTQDTARLSRILKTEPGRAVNAKFYKYTNCKIVNFALSVVYEDIHRTKAQAIEGRAQTDSSAYGKSAGDQHVLCEPAGKQPEEPVRQGAHGVDRKLRGRLAEPRERY